jgi:DNA-binding transcriptional regulator GbsR (MarR family)
MDSPVDASAITGHIKARISDIEEQLKHHQSLNDELERLRGALERLEGEIRSGVSTVRRGSRARKGSSKPAPSRKPATARSASTTRAPRGQNKAKILAALKDGPMTASDISAKTGIGRASASTMLTTMAKRGDIVKADRGYALPK